ENSRSEKPFLTVKTTGETPVPQFCHRLLGRSTSCDSAKLDCVTLEQLPATGATGSLSARASVTCAGTGGQAASGTHTRYR
ncbi:MAG: hypothetical protein JXQ75_05395, partial [Phycisphaerae bacterium]|nr:hypothetical protein [Phycisphaerae bacterium]